MTTLDELQHQLNRVSTILDLLKHQNHEGPNVLLDIDSLQETLRQMYLLASDLRIEQHQPEKTSATDVQTAENKITEQVEERHEEKEPEQVVAPQEPQQEAKEETKEEMTKEEHPLEDKLWKMHSFVFPTVVAGNLTSENGIASVQATEPSISLPEDGNDTPIELHHPTFWLEDETPAINENSPSTPDNPVDEPASDETPEKEQTNEPECTETNPAVTEEETPVAEQDTDTTEDVAPVAEQDTDATEDVASVAEEETTEQSTADEVESINTNESACEGIFQDGPDQPTILVPTNIESAAETESPVPAPEETAIVAELTETPNTDAEPVEEETPVAEKLAETEETSAEPSIQTEQIVAVESEPIIEPSPATSAELPQTDEHQEPEYAKAEEPTTVTPAQFETPETTHFVFEPVNEDEIPVATVPIVEDAPSASTPIEEQTSEQVLSGEIADETTVPIVDATALPEQEKTPIAENQPVEETIVLAESVVLTPELEKVQPTNAPEADRPSPVQASVPTPEPATAPVTTAHSQSENILANTPQPVIFEDTLNIVEPHRPLVNSEQFELQRKQQEIEKSNNEGIDLRPISIWDAENNTERPAVTDTPKPPFVNTDYPTSKAPVADLRDFDKRINEERLQKQNSENQNNTPRKQTIFIQQEPFIQQPSTVEPTLFDKQVQPSEVPSPQSAPGTSSNSNFQSQEIQFDVPQNKNTEETADNTPKRLNINEIPQYTTRESSVLNILTSPCGASEPVDEPIVYTSPNINIARELYNKYGADHLGAQPISDLRSAISINDKFSFLSELFESDQSTYNATIQQLNATENLDEGLSIVGDVAKRFQWDDGSATVATFMRLFGRKFITK